jgi:hypothetical protein
VNASVLNGLVTSSIAVVLVCVWIIIYRRRRTLGYLLQLIGIPCLLIVALAHVFEAFELLPSMGWGQTQGPGHYIDLVAAVLGTATVLLGLLLQRTSLHRR